MTAEYSVTGRELAKAVIADLNSGHADRVARARRAAPTVDRQPASTR